VYGPRLGAKHKTSLPQAVGSTDSVGIRLRRRREQLGESIDNVVRETRLSKQTIEAIEADQYEGISSDFHTRGFLKIYARYLEFDPVAVLEAYDRQTTVSRLIHSGEDDNSDIVPNYFRAQPVTSTSRGLSPAQTFLLVMTALIIVGFMLSVNRSNETRPDVAARPGVSAPGTPATATNGGQVPGVAPRGGDGSRR